MLEMCTFVVGDGTGGTEYYIGNTTTEDECAILVRSRQPSANGATWRVGATNGATKSCYAEFGATGRRIWGNNFYFFYLAAETESPRNS